MFTSTENALSERAPGRLGRWVLCLLLTAWLGTALAADAPPAQRVRITADKLVAVSAARSAEFIGNVRAVQGTTVITAERLKVYYGAGQAPRVETDPDDDPAGEIEKVVCTGQVVIHFDKKVATGRKAVYTAADAVLVLSGPEAKVTSEKNSVVGEKITVFRNEDRMLVEGGSQRRVEAVFFPKGKGLK